MALEKQIRLGTRASALARWQSDWVATQLNHFGVQVELVPIRTSGDVRSGPIASIGGQGVFTKEIQTSLLNEDIDIAVHSLKDLPTVSVNGLCLAAVPMRESASDALVCSRVKTIAELPNGARVGTGSVRRRAQLLALRSDLEISEVRGNVDTRLRRLDEGRYDALVLAEAGLSRLNLSQRIAEVIPKEVMLPAVGQGALGLEIRSDDSRTSALVSQLNHPDSFASVSAERSMLSRLRGGCLAPVGAWGRIDQQTLILDGVVLSIDGRKRLFSSVTGPLDEAEQIGVRVADELLSQGADDLLASSRPN